MRFRTILTIALSAVLIGLGGAVGASPTFGESGPEFIELSYYETQMSSGGSPSITNCESVEPGLTVCDFAGSGTGSIHGTHVGLSTETINGTISFTSDPCVKLDGSAATVSQVDADGTIFSQVGDQLHFRLRSPICGGELLPAYWTITGGTGRFQNASGTMSGRSGQDGEPNISVGTLRVRADLWEDILPSPPRPEILPGAAGVAEGDSGQTVVDIPVNLSRPASGVVTVDWATLDTGAPGIATEGVDYVAAAGTVTFAPGETTKTVSITVEGDTDVEPPLLYGEWGLVQFSNPSANADLTDALEGRGVFIIVDDD